MSSLGDDSHSQFDSLIRPHLTRLYRLAYRLTGRAAEAEDLLQDVLIKLYRRRDELSSIEELAPWLGRVLFNQFLDYARRQRRSRLRLVALPDDDGEGESRLPPDDFDLEAVTDSALDVRRVQAALDALSTEHRAVLLMHDAEGYKLQEIQRITGVPIGTLKSRLHRARARLRELVGDEGTIRPVVACEE